MTFTIVTRRRIALSPPTCPRHSAHRSTSPLKLLYTTVKARCIPLDLPQGPMPKRRIPKYDIKPSIPAHPSLSSSGKPNDAAHSLGSDISSNGNSVNERLQQLRLSQGSQHARASSDVLSPAANPSLPPPLRNILQLPNAPQPRPRTGLRVAGRARGPAGPVPPSWLLRRENRPNNITDSRTNPARRETSRDERLPGSVPLNERSLRAITLKAIAKNWDWHLQYDQYYLATILVRYKEEILHYLRCYSPQGIDRAGLELLFLDDTEVEDATGAEGLTHLDLSTFIGNSLKLTELRHLFSVKKVVELAEDSESPPESWDAPGLVAQPSGLSPFHSLTHLSLAHPSPTTSSWKGLLDLGPHLTTITHLSLAYWPTPTLAPNSKTAYRETPQGNVNYGASNYYSAYDNDWSEAASIIRRLGRSTYCLKWLDLTGCYPWVKALERLDWSESMQALETVKIGQGWIPECFKDNFDERAWHRIIYRVSISDDTIAARRRADALGWAHIEAETLSLETNINARISANMEHSSSQVAPQPVREHRNGDSEWKDMSPEPSSRIKFRSTRLVFDRGWNAWWIRKAIEERPISLRPYVG